MSAETEDNTSDRPEDEIAPAEKASPEDPAADPPQTAEEYVEQQREIHEGDTA